MSGVRLKTSLPIASCTAQTTAATPAPNAASPMPRAPTGVVGSGKSTKSAFISSGISKIDGGFAFARQNGEIILDINPTATIFAIQALSMWDEGQQGAFRDPWETLI